MTGHITIQVHITRFTGMRIMHNYRNISRATKQFMMGDRFLEQLMILQLREHFFRPMYYNAPIENTFFMVSYPFVVIIAGTFPRWSYWSPLCSLCQQPAPTLTRRLRRIQQILTWFARQDRSRTIRRLSQALQLGCRQKRISSTS